MPKILSKSRHSKKFIMKENVFTVDLGNVKLTPAQRNEINAAIQIATTSILAKSGISKSVVLFPMDKFPGGPIIYGLVARTHKEIGPNLKIKELLGSTKK